MAIRFAFAMPEKSKSILRFENEKKFLPLCRVVRMGIDMKGEAHHE